MISFNFNKTWKILKKLLNKSYLKKNKKLLQEIKLSGTNNISFLKNANFILFNQFFLSYFVFFF